MRRFLDYCTELIEVGLLRLAILILRERNVARYRIISRRDNNDLWGMSERIESIIQRIESNYKDE